jgi:nitrate reductase molybdenum cofactor assembly chaperone NarJ/NarW
VSAKHPKPRLDARALAITWQSVSLLMGYPDEELLDRLEMVVGASHELPASVGEGLRETAVRLRETPLQQLQEQYVETFDTRRRCNLFLTYFLHGDTRKRGVALLRFKQTYLRSGFVLDESADGAGELPDHLCVVLEYAATIDQRLGWGLLLDHRAGLELLRLSLREDGSVWAPAVQALCATLPPLRGDEHEAVRRLAAEGPPEEEVGLSAYPTELPMPSFPGAR